MLDLLRDLIVENPVSAPDPEQPPIESPSRRGSMRQGVLLIVAVAALVGAAAFIRETTPMRSMLRSLRSGDGATRLEAATNLSNMNIVDLGTAIPGVGAAMVGDPSAEVRTEATRTMGTLGAEAITHLEDSLRNQALGALLAAIDDKDPKVSGLAISMISVLAQSATKLSANENDLAPLGAPKAVVAKLLPLLNSPDETLRSAAANTLGFFPIQLDPSLPMLLKAAVDEKPAPNSRGRGVMANLFRKIRPLKSSLPFLMESIGSDDLKLRSYAIMALGQMSTDAVDAVPALVRIVKEPAGANDPEDPGRAAATALGAIAPGTPSASEAIKGLEEAQASAPEGRKRAITVALRGLEATP